MTSTITSPGREELLQMARDCTNKQIRAAEQGLAELHARLITLMRSPAPVITYDCRIPSATVVPSGVGCKATSTESITDALTKLRAEFFRINPRRKARKALFSVDVYVKVADLYIRMEAEFTDEINAIFGNQALNSYIQTISS